MKFRIVKTDEDEIKLQRKRFFWWFTEEATGGIDKTFRNLTEAHDYAERKYGPKNPPTVVYKFKL